MAASKTQPDNKNTLPATPSIKKGPILKPKFYAIILLIVILVLYSISTLLTGSSLKVLSGNENFTLPANGTLYFQIQGNQNTYALQVRNPSLSGATLYISGTPVLSKPVVVLTLSSGGTSNVSTNASAIANIHVVLISSKNGSATLSLNPIVAGLNIKTSPGISIVNPVSLSHGNSTLVTVTTTVSANSTTNANSTTSTPTTTIATTNDTIPQVEQVADSSSLGTLMNNFNNLYASDKSCTPASYNSTFQTYVKTRPSGQLTFENLSPVTPTAINTVIQNVGNNKYNLTYGTIAQSSVATGPVLVIEVSLNTNTVVSQSAFQGIFAGATESLLNSTYVFQKNIGNACGALIPAPS